MLLYMDEHRLNQFNIDISSRINTLNTLVNQEKNKDLVYNEKELMLLNTLSANIRKILALHKRTKEERS